jgi:hypothetical protein
MRKVIAFIVLGALVSALLSSPAQALQYDPKNPRPHQVVSRSGSGDDGGFDPPVESPPPPGDIIQPTLLTSLFLPHYGVISLGFIMDIVLWHDVESDDTTDCGNIQQSQGSNTQ